MYFLGCYSLQLPCCLLTLLNCKSSTLSRAEYVQNFININYYLNTAFSEYNLIHKLARHFGDDIIRACSGFQIRTLQDFVVLLEREDIADKISPSRRGYIQHEFNEHPNTVK